MRKETDEIVTIGNETLRIKSVLKISKEIICLTIENSLTFEFSKNLLMAN